VTRNADRYRIELDVGAGASRDAGPPRVETPFSILLVGDFGGRREGDHLAPAAGEAKPRARRPILVDRDSIDEVISRVGPVLRLTVSPGRSPIEIRFSGLDDFTPDRLYERLPHLQSLREARERRGRSAMRSPPMPPSAGRAGEGGGLLDQILGDEPPPPAGGSGRSPRIHESERYDSDEAFADFVRRAVEPHRVSGPDPEHDALVAETDRVIAAELRAILHHPDFQRLESAWRGAAFLARRLETGESLRLSLIDVTLGELARDLANLESGAVSPDSVARAIVRGDASSGDQPWTLLVGLYEFGASAEDLMLLARLAELARAAGAVWLSAAAPALVGAASFAPSVEFDDWATAANPAWDAVRGLEAAPHVGLISPRMLLRLPYGEDTDPCEALPFEEFATEGAVDHADYLWGNGALAGALLLGDAFGRDGWTLRPDLHVTGLPLYIGHVDGAARATPCAESLLTDRAVLHMLGRGVMPLASARERDVARLARFQSIAAPAKPLAGRWTIG